MRINVNYFYNKMFVYIFYINQCLNIYIYIHISTTKHTSCRNKMLVTERAVKIKEVSNYFCIIEMLLNLQSGNK